MYPVRGKGPLPTSPLVSTRKWIVYYRVVENTVYVRGLWPTRIP